METLKDTILLKWGDIGVAKAPMKIRTELGSCVAVVFYDSVKKIGGMTHIVEPKAKAEKLTKFADVAVKELLNRMIFEHGCRKSDIICSVYGASMPFDINIPINLLNLAQVNRELAGEKIKFGEIDIGGERCRIIILDCATGKVEKIILNSFEELGLKNKLKKKD